MYLKTRYPGIFQSDGQREEYHGRQTFNDRRGGEEAGGLEELGLPKVPVPDYASYPDWRSSENPGEGPSGVVEWP